MPAPMTDQKMAERILAHIERRTTDLGDAIWREPIANYVSPERFAVEVNQVLRRWPTPFCPSAALPSAGAYVARVAAGTPILAVRDEAGQVRAFRNVCRHRGMEVASGSGCRKAFACPYHGWTYGLDGSLKRVPHEQGFPDLDKTTHGLVPVQAEERLGLVFVTQDEPITADDSLADWPQLFGANHRLLDVRETEVPANWKVFLEGFLEGYHIRPAHPQTFYPYGYDNLNVVEPLGPNSRITFPFRRIEALAKVKPEERRVEGLLTYVYHLFPNTFVTMLSQHINLVVLEPIDLGRTRMVIYTLTDRSDEEAERDRAFVDQTGAAEDRAIACAIQRGIGSGANQEFLFGKFESAIVNFHRTLDRVLKEVRA